MYPGRLYVADATAFAKSARRLVDFTRDLRVAHVLGAHIEEARTPFLDYPIGTKFQPDEHKLELTRGHLLELNAALEPMGGDDRAGARWPISRSGRSELRRRSSIEFSMTTSRNRFDVIVVGLGAMGSATAYHLALRGRRVLGLDRWSPGHTFGSSHGDSRIIREAYFEHPMYVPILRRAYDLWRELEVRSGEALLHEIGGLMIGPRDGELVTGTLRSAAEFGIGHDVLSPDQVRRAVSGVSSPARRSRGPRPSRGLPRPRPMQRGTSARRCRGRRHAALRRVGPVVERERRRGSRRDKQWIVRRRPSGALRRRADAAARRERAASARRRAAIALLARARCRGRAVRSRRFPDLPLSIRGGVGLLVVLRLSSATTRNQGGRDAPGRGASAIPTPFGGPLTTRRSRRSAARSRRCCPTWRGRLCARAQSVFSRTRPIYTS